MVTRPFYSGAIGPPGNLLRSNCSPWDQLPVTSEFFSCTKWVKSSRYTRRSWRRWRTTSRSSRSPWKKGHRRRSTTCVTPLILNLRLRLTRITTLEIPVEKEGETILNLPPTLTLHFPILFPNPGHTQMRQRIFAPQAPGTGPTTGPATKHTQDIRRPKDPT